MAEAKRSMRTPLGRVRAHGASGQGTGHFIGQRVSAMALLVLATWFVISAAVTMHGPTYQDAIDFLDWPLNAVGVILLVVVGTYHMCVGMQVIIEDYIARPLTRTLLLLLNIFIPTVAATGAIFAVLIVNFGGKV
jgi:succinate dehydrogenase / fumarate reductase membrane anchor subunit